MKGLVINGFENIELKRDIPFPTLGDDEALIKIKYIGICGSDLHHYHNANAPIGGRPHVFGHEFVGTVVESTDHGDARYQVGDFVTAIPYTSCGMCDYCRAGRESLCVELKLLGVGRNGVYTEYVKVPSSNVYPFREGINQKIAALTEPLAIAVFDVQRIGLKVGQSVFISGGGPIGILIGIVSRMAGALHVVFSEINENRNEFIRKMGFTALNPTTTDVFLEAMNLNGNRKFNCCFEVSGAQPGYDLAIQLVKNGGTFSPIALPFDKRSFDIRTITRMQIEWIGSNLYEAESFEDAVRIVNSGRLDEQLLACVTDVFSLEQAKEAYLFAMNPKGNHVKVLIDAQEE